jgi:hypothetical protein
VAPAYRTVATFSAPEYGATVRLLRRQAIEAIDRPPRQGRDSGN